MLNVDEKAMAYCLIEALFAAGLLNLGAPAGASRYHEPYAITTESPPSKDSGLFTASHIGNIAPVSSSMAGTVTSIHTVEWATA